MSGSSRRRFLTRTAAGSALVSLGDMSILSRLRPVTAAESALDPGIVRFQPEIEPLVRLLEETPRQDVLAKFAERIQAGTSYREVLAALLLAGVRNVQPRPSVGFKFHAVLVVNSAHLASLSSPESDRWLPIFWALDYFKSSQQRDMQEGDWTMAPVNEPNVPPPHRARRAFVRAMDAWDVEGVDVAVAGLTRSAGANQIFELFARYAARDFRSIGHKAIFLANSWRTLQCIGWQYAEPVLRSLAYALLNHTGEPNPATGDLKPDRPWRRNTELRSKLRSNWRNGKLDSNATRDLLVILRGGSDTEACDQVVQLLNQGIAPQSLYDALFVGAGELLMRQPGIVALHAVTSTNALHYLFQQTANDAVRQAILLQNAAFLPMFRSAMQDRGKVSDLQVDQFSPAAAETQHEKTAVRDGHPSPSLEHIFQQVSDNRMQAAVSVFNYLNQDQSAMSFINSARRMIFLKGTDSHDYKFSSAVLEDYFHVSPEWRNVFLATSVFKLRGSKDRDNGLIRRTRNALDG